ncbi:hypothetical protein P7K49_002222 [Saguinus oedipus]|uniref:Uncharacterized protein n=1 Tax=Saguinus oedipus TaxID=9490 RepID=A0ABQ9WGS7_SAGOE|nr:hypothetical protein P7K49_002222 [Saguinus oedipus]
MPRPHRQRPTGHARSAPQATPSTHAASPRPDFRQELCAPSFSAPPVLASVRQRKCSRPAAAVGPRFRAGRGRCAAAPAPQVSDSGPLGPGGRPGRRGQSGAAPGARAEGPAPGGAGEPDLARELSRPPVLPACPAGPACSALPGPGGPSFPRRGGARPGEPGFLPAALGPV